MREMKFRAWYQEQMLGPVTLKELITDSDWHPDGVIWMQYTGLKDKRGREIYEGDVVRRVGGGLLGSPEKVLFVGEVVFTNSGYKAKYLYDEPGSAGKYRHEAQGNLFNRSELEVIGNVHENPELVEPQQ